MEAWSFCSFRVQNPSSSAATDRLKDTNVFYDEFNKSYRIKAYLHIHLVSLYMPS